MKLKTVGTKLMMKLTVQDDRGVEHQVREGGFPSYQRTDSAKKTQGGDIAGEGEIEDSGGDGGFSYDELIDGGKKTRGGDIPGGGVHTTLLKFIDMISISLLK